MKSRAVAASALLVYVAWSVAPVLADAEFSDFRIPRHQWHTLRGNLGGSFWGDHGHSISATSDVNQRDRFLNGILGGSFASSLDSDELRWTYALSTSVEGDRQDRWIDYASQILPLSSHSAQHTEDQVRDARELWSADFEIRKYSSLPITLIARADGVGQYTQSRTERIEVSRVDSPGSSTRSENESEDVVHEYRHQAIGQLSAGWGRVRDATAVYVAWLLERRLLESGALARPLSREARARIAALYYVQPEYSAVHDRPARFFWREVERALRDDGALSDRGAGAYDWMYLLEPYVAGAPLGRTPFLRQTGFYAGLTLSGEHRHDFRRIDSVMNQLYFVNDSLLIANSTGGVTDQTFSNDQALMGGEAEYHRPMGVRWQLDARTSALVPVRHPDRGLRLISSASAGYVIADRWFATASLNHQRMIFEKSSEPPSGWTVGYGAKLGYYIEDRTAFSLSLDQSQDDEAFLFVTGPVRNHAGFTRITLTLSHQFLGRLEAPGLIEPEGLLPTSSPY